MPERTKAPEFKQIDKIAIQEAIPHTLKNGIPLYSINSGSQEILKIEFLFEAGPRYQKAPLIANAVNNLISEGTKNRAASEIAEFIDYYGAFLQAEAGKDNASVVLYTLNKHLAKVLPLVKEILSEAVFPISELSLFIKNNKQKYQVENQKVDNLARRHFLNMLFGGNNYYGYYLKESDYDNLNRADLLEFYKQRYSPAYCTIIAAGLITDEVIDTITEIFGSSWGQVDAGLPAKMDLMPPLEKSKLVEKKDALQSAIRIGRPLFNKTHSDFPGMQVLNTILGGYFGSRLMANIREDKGYTYGIGSGIVSLKDAGYFFISTEVGVDVCQNAIDEINKEIGRLRDSLVPENELSLVRNYMMGVFLKNVDGPFSLADRFKSIYEYGLGYEYYDRMFETIKKITPEEIRALANKYLQQEDLLELVAGKK
jgi:zinc protease